MIGGYFGRAQDFGKSREGILDDIAHDWRTAAWSSARQGFGRNERQHSQDFGAKIAVDLLDRAENPVHDLAVYSARKTYQCSASHGQRQNQKSPRLAWLHRFDRIVCDMRVDHRKT